MRTAAAASLLAAAASPAAAVRGDRKATAQQNPFFIPGANGNMWHGGGRGPSWLGNQTGNEYLLSHCPSEAMQWNNTPTWGMYCLNGEDGTTDMCDTPGACEKCGTMGVCCKMGVEETGTECTGRIGGYAGDQAQWEIDVASGNNTPTWYGCYCPEHPLTGVSGDPFTVDENGAKVQFFLPPRQLVHLLTCKDFKLYGSAMQSPVPGDLEQWFEEFRVLAGMEELRLKVRNNTALDQAAAGDAAAELRRTRADAVPGADEEDAPAGGGRPLTSMVVRVAGTQRDRTGLVRMKAANVTVSRKAGHIGDTWMETVTVETAAGTVQFDSAPATKFEDPKMQRSLMHLDATFDLTNVQACTAGVLAEIWGAVPMSKATTRLLQPDARSR